MWGPKRWESSIRLPNLTPPEYLACTANTHSIRNTHKKKMTKLHYQKWPASGLAVAMGYNNHNDKALFCSRPGLHVFRFNIAVFTKVMMQIEKKIRFVTVNYCLYWLCVQREGCLIQDALGSVMVTCFLIKALFSHT